MAFISRNNEWRLQPVSGKQRRTLHQQARLLHARGLTPMSVSDCDGWIKQEIAILHAARVNGETIKGKVPEPRGWASDRIDLWNQMLDGDGGKKVKKPRRKFADPTK